MRESEMGAQKGSEIRVRVEGKSWGSTGGTGRIVTGAVSTRPVVCDAR